MHGVLHDVLVAELQRGGRQQFLLDDVLQASAPHPVLHGPFANLRVLEQLPLDLRFGNPVPLGDDVQQQLQLFDGRVYHQRRLHLYRDTGVPVYPVSRPELRLVERVQWVQQHVR